MVIRPSYPDDWTRHGKPLGMASDDRQAKGELLEAGALMVCYTTTNHILTCGDAT